MGGIIKARVDRKWCLILVSVLAMVLIAAGVDLEQNWTRLQSLPRERRLKLIENLRRFDLVLKADQQRSLRELDRRIAELPQPQRDQYLAAMRRYDNWINHLPENRREELLDKPPDERMPTILKMIAGNNRVPKLETGRFLQIADIGEFSPFELASIYKIWQHLNANQRQAVEKKPAAPQRLEELFRLGKAKDIGREIVPESFDEQKWLSDTENHLRLHRPMLYFDELKKKADVRRPQILRRQAINYFFLDKKPETVNSDRLAAFVAAFPAFVQSSFEQFPPDEARRRLAIVYRLVFPAGQEMKLIPAGAAPAKGGRPAPTSKRGEPKPTGKTEKETGGSAF